MSPSTKYIVRHINKTNSNWWITFVKQHLCSTSTKFSLIFVHPLNLTGFPESIGKLKIQRASLQLNSFSIILFSVNKTVIFSFPICRDNLWQNLQVLIPKYKPNHWHPKLSPVISYLLIIAFFFFLKCNPHFCLILLQNKVERKIFV